MRLRDNTSTSVGTTDNLDLIAYEELTIDFGYYPRSMDNSNEDFWLQISTDGGSNFITVEEWNRDDEFVNNQFYTDQIIIPGPFTSTTQLRFRADASGNQDWVYIDDIVISGCTTGAARGATNTVVNNEKEVKIKTTPIINESTIYPNPFVDQISIAIQDDYENAEIQLFNTLGQALIVKTFKNSRLIEIPTYNLPIGQYFIRINIDDDIITKQVIKK